jgi:hypothetical protein
VPRKKVIDLEVDFEMSEELERELITEFERRAVEEAERKSRSTIY